MKNTERLIAMIERAYSLALGAQDNQIDHELAEEVTGECAEFLAHWNNDEGSFGDEDCKDQELVDLVRTLKGA